MKIDNFKPDLTVDREATIYIHPTSLCNLSCQHCYSNSSPFVKNKGAEPEVYRPFLQYARREGFANINITGGEPFIYGGLEDLVLLGKEEGYSVSVTTNGTLLKTTRAKQILPLIDRLSLSIDGVPMIHNEVRNDPRAFDRALEGIQIAQRHTENFGIIHTLTTRSWDSLLWFGDFAYENGARFLEINPLELTGRAAIDMLMLELDQITLHKVYFLSQYMQNKFSGELQIMLNVSHKNYIEKNPAVVNVYPNVKHYADQPLASLIKSLVIDENGDIVPLSYGFSRQFLISNINYFDGAEDIFNSFLSKHGKEIKNLFMQAYWKMVNDKENDLFNVNEYLMSESLRKEISENVA